MIASTPLTLLEQENERAARDEAAQRLKQVEAQLENLKKGRRPSELEAIRAQRRQAEAALKLAQAEYAPPVLYNRENRNKLVYMVETRPAPAAAEKLRPSQPLDVRL